MRSDIVWLVLAIFFVSLVFLWGLICLIGDGIMRPFVRRIRYRLAARQLRRYWRTHPYGPLEQWDAQHRG